MRLHGRLLTLVEGQAEWFKGREFVEAFEILLALHRGDSDAYARFTAALASVERADIFAASWLIAEVGPALMERYPEELSAVVRSYADRPEVLDSPLIRDRFGVMMLNSTKTVDRA
jgi:hypothetical protein